MKKTNVASEVTKIMSGMTKDKVMFIECNKRSYIAVRRHEEPRMHDLHKYVDPSDAYASRCTQVRYGNKKTEQLYEELVDEPLRKQNRQQRLNCQGRTGQADIVSYVEMGITKDA